MMKLANIIKKRSSQFQLGPLDCTFDAGEAIALFGKNGAGKSTLFELITGQEDADSGEITINQQKLAPQKIELKKNLGYLPQELELPVWLTPKELIGYAAKLHNVDAERCAEMLRFWGIDVYESRALEYCSYGMTKRVGLAVCLVHNPAIAILDEPLNGLDLEYVKKMEQLIEQRIKAGKLTIMSLHSTYFAAKFCSRAYYIEQGMMRELTNWKMQPWTERLNLIEPLFETAGAP